ncbi:MAG: tRNA (cytidine(56)-2'-O)-methyltransferase, partial [Thermoproteota archaeon]|nr:tRNA (cytidine(56)-2'-O)-methyltransferase [Thermoproteota archaeon]
MNISVLRIGHRLVRDDRVTTHAALVARAFGADMIYMTGSLDGSINDTV